MSLTSCFFNVKSPTQAVADADSEILCVPARYIREWQRKYDQWNEFIIRTFHSRYNELLNSFNSVAFDTIENRVIDYLNGYAARQHTTTIPVTHLVNCFAAAYKSLSYSFSCFVSKDTFQKISRA